MLQVVGLKKHYKTPEGTVKALDGVTFTLPDATVGAIVGRSGSGKSTLLALLGALDTPDSGRMILDGEDVAALAPDFLVRFRRRSIGLVFQDYKLVPTLTALQNVMLPMELAGVAFRKRRHRARQLLTAVGLGSEFEDRKPSKMSGGQQQRVAIARALANSPRLLLADEPTGNLDSQTSDQIFKVLSRVVHEQKMSAIIVTHDEDLASRADVVHQLRDGRIVESKTVQRAKPRGA